MNAAVARNIAHSSHVDHRDRNGYPLVEHVERVAASVSPDARTIAFLHDLLERTDTSLDDLRAQGLTATELAALDLLTRGADESYEAHSLRIALASGPAARVALEVKLADLDDHLNSGPVPPGAPPYRWARRHMATGLERVTTSG
jgi:(p)ppGpp synthase/HD superfamily hydrolase